MRADLASGATGLAVAVAVSAGALAMPMGTLGNPGAGFLPFWVGIALGIMSLALALGACRASGARQPGDEGWTGWRVTGMVVALLLSVLALEPVGYLPTTFLLLAALLRILGERRWPTVLVFAAVATAGSYALFGSWLGVPLPAGRLLPWP